MKGILEYDLSNKDEEMAMKRAIKSTDMACVLFEISMNLRKQCEWELEAMEADSDIWDGIDVVFRKLNELFEQNNINIEEIIA